MSEESSAVLEGVISQIPFGLFLLTTAHDGYRGGVLARWVQRCAVNPPMVMVAIPKGQSVEPLILNSRSFALCRISPDDRYLLRKFTTPAERGEDQFVAISTRNAPSGSPIVDRAVSFLDCQVIRHLELESDHRVYVGQVSHAGHLRQQHGMVGNGQAMRPGITNGNGNTAGNGSVESSSSGATNGTNGTNGSGGTNGTNGTNGSNGSHTNGHSTNGESTPGAGDIDGVRRTGNPPGMLGTPGPRMPGGTADRSEAADEV